MLLGSSADCLDYLQQYGRRTLASLACPFRAWEQSLAGQAVEEYEVRAEQVRVRKDDVQERLNEGQARYQGQAQHCAVEYQWVSEEGHLDLSRRRERTWMVPGLTDLAATATRLMHYIQARNSRFRMKRR